GAFKKAGAVVSNSGITNTIFQLSDPGQYSEEFLAKASKIRVNNSSCQVYIGIKEGEHIDHIGDLLFTSLSPEFDSAELLDINTRSKTFSVYYPKTRPGLERYTIVASMNSNYDDWAALEEQDYRSTKQHMIDRTIVDLERYLPAVKTKIDWLEAATPLTFSRYTLHTKGTSFGTKFEGLDVSRTIFKEVNGLFHVGSVGIIMSGWLGAINYGVIVANDVDGYLRSL
ncbi:MAG: phytoene dehydrogenase, partial [Desulfofustis sp.]|nr:phytoene dehydrogenase [Desulfofustis sp.]